MKDSYQTAATNLGFLAAGLAIGALAGYVIDRLLNKKPKPAVPMNPMPPMPPMLPYLPLMSPEEMFGGFPMEGEEIPPYFVVQLVNREGERLDVAFSPEEWEILHALAEMSGDPFEKVLVDVVMERRENGTL